MEQGTSSEPGRGARRVRVRVLALGVLQLGLGVMGMLSVFEPVQRWTDVQARGTRVLVERGDLDLRGLAAEWGFEPERAVERFPEMLWKSGRSDRDVGSLLAVHGVHQAAMGVLG